MAIWGSSPKATSGGTRAPCSAYGQDEGQGIPPNPQPSPEAVGPAVGAVEEIGESGTDIETGSEGDEAKIEVDAEIFKLLFSSSVA
ncbi:hypothetical protein U1Q18_023396, partial [Sarracenia purpurea var. burkii]